IQAWEYVPLGPFLGKSFATSISPWVVPTAALEPFRVQQPVQEPEPLGYLRGDGSWGLDIDLEVGLRSSAMTVPDIVSETNFKDMYWSPVQQIAHMTVNGASLRTGDVCASGTVSGSEPGSYGSLIELSWNGSEPIQLGDDSTRTFLQDGDQVTLRGLASNEESTVGLGEVTGVIVP
ncbi:MAG: fumarylacetoacetase, partial [Acidimicrobiia bacterium]|nr:fumarylacetoacetase [Acidimicrobiia bacterium]